MGHTDSNNIEFPNLCGRKRGMSAALQDSELILQDSEVPNLEVDNYR